MENVSLKRQIHTLYLLMTHFIPFFFEKKLFYLKSTIFHTLYTSFYLILLVNDVESWVPGKKLEEDIFMGFRNDFVKKWNNFLTKRLILDLKVSFQPPMGDFYVLRTYSSINLDVLFSGNVFFHVWLHRESENAK